MYYSKDESPKEISITKVFIDIATEDGDAPFPEHLNYHVVRVTIDSATYIQVKDANDMPTLPRWY